MQASGKDAEEQRQKQLELEQRENVLYEQEVICEMEKAEVSDQRERNTQQEEEDRMERKKVESDKLRVESEREKVTQIKKNQEFMW